MSEDIIGSMIVITLLTFMVLFEIWIRESK
jgi:hypothetical protein